MLGANCTARLMALYPDNAGAAAGLLIAAMFGLGAVASLAVSALHDGTPWAMCLVIFVFGLVSLTGRIVLAREARRVLSE